MSEVLVTALAVALTRWSGAGSVTIDLEGHGRDEDIVRGDGAAHVDLTRTVGWFTTVFPVALEIGTAAPDLEASGELAGGFSRASRSNFDASPPTPASGTEHCDTWAARISWVASQRRRWCSTTWDVLLQRRGTGSRCRWTVLPIRPCRWDTRCLSTS